MTGRIFSLRVSKTVLTGFAAAALLVSGFFAPSANAELSLIVQSPNGGELLGGGAGVIEWTSAGGIPGDLVDIALIDEVLGSSAPIATSVPFDETPYSWVDLPLVADGSNYKVRIFKAGTTLAYDSSNEVFAVDNTPPTITAVTTYDDDVDGSVDRAVISFSEAIRDSSFAPGDFSIDGSLGTSIVSGIEDDVTLDVIFSDVEGTGVKTLTYTPGIGTDLAILGNALAGDFVFAADAAAPVFLSAKTVSTTTINLTFSEDLDESTVNLSGDEFTVVGHTVSGASETSPGVVTLALSTTMGTEETPGVTFTNIDYFEDLAGNEAVSPITLTATDGVAPVLSEVTPVTTPTNNNTPDYTFSSSETGTINYLGGCTSVTTTALADDNPITFGPLVDGPYDCTINVTDDSGNESTPLLVSSFFIDTTTPLVNAGADQTVNTEVLQDATVTDPDPSSGLTYLWTKEDGPGSITFGSASSEDTTLAADSDGTYTIRLTVVDGASNTAYDEMILVWDTVPPTLSVLLPIDDVVYKSNPPLQFTPDDTDTAVECSYVIDIAPPIPVKCTKAVLVDETIPGLSDGRHSVVVTVTDEADNSISSSPISFVYDDNNTLTVDDDSPADFETIQAAVDAATPGDTVLVSEGTYDESVLVTKQLDLTSLDIIKPVITGSIGVNYIVKIDGVNGVLMNNFEINGGGLGAGDNTFGYGILVNSSGIEANPVDIGNVTVKNIWKVSSNGIGIENSSYALVHDSFISSFHKRGIRFIDSAGEFYVNEVVGDNVDGTSRVQNLVNLWGGSTVEIYGNTLHNARTTLGVTPTWDSPGIFVSSYGGSGPSHADIHDNEIYDGDIGIVIGSYYATTDTSSATIINNDLHDLNWAINFEKGTVSATITYNRLSAFNRGVSADNGHGGPDIRPTVNAEKNWWSRVSGPETVEIYPEVDYSPWCTNPECTEFGSNGPLDELVLSFVPNPVIIPDASELTVTAVDDEGITLVNDTRQIELNGGGTTRFDGIAGPTLINLAGGVLTTDVTETTPGMVNVVAKVLGVPFGSGQVEFIAGETPDTEAPVVTSFIVSGITDFNAALAVTTNENATCRYAPADSAYEAMTDMDGTGTTIHIHPLSGLLPNTQYNYYVRCQDIVPNTMSVSAHAVFTTLDTPVDPPTGVVATWEAQNSFAQANDSYLDGWHYVFRVTVYDMGETNMSVKFSNWVNTADPLQTVPASPNMRLLINEDGGMVAGVGSDAMIESGFGSVKSYALGNDYVDQTLDGIPTPIDISGIDNDETAVGRQVQFDVFTKIPIDTVPGFYETSYGIETL